MRAQDRPSDAVTVTQASRSPNFEVLQTATVNPTKYFGLQERVGTVAPGQRADLVLLDANPLTDITNIQKIRAVIIAGQLLDNQELDRMLAEVKRAASHR